MNMRSQEEDIPKCCFCCNVKFGTFFLAALVLTGGIMTVISASMFLSGSVEYDDYINCNSQEYYYMCGRSAQLLSLGTGLCLILIALMSIFGVSKQRPSYLVPLFFVQVFGFLCSIVYIGTVMFYWPSIKSYLVQCPHMPEEMKQWVSNLNEGWLSVIVFGVLFLDLFLKGFFISIIYRCYRHLMWKAVNRTSRDPEVNCVTDTKSSELKSLPPKYEDVQKIPLVDDVDEPDTKPPPYST